jgi:hypothetical protein
MLLRACGACAALALGLGLAAPASAQNRLTIVVMPAQHFAADPESAAAVTQGLAEQYERQGYTVLAADRSRQVAESMGLGRSIHYPDATAVRFGREAGADLVAYPRLLAMGVPSATTPAAAGLLAPTAVVHLRVLNVHTGQPIYFRQIGHEFRVADPAVPFVLPQPIATAAAAEITNLYFQAVAGSQQEFRGTR